MATSMNTFSRAALIALLATSAVAQDPSGDSIVRCTFLGNALSNSRSQEVSAAAAVAATTTAYICDSGDVTSAETSALAVATEVATASAAAIAAVFVECSASGMSTFTVNGRSLAIAEAAAIATSFAEAATEASICGECQTAAEFIADSFEAIFVNATALAEVALMGAANGEEIEASQEDFIAKIINATTTAFAKVMVEARADVEDGCSGNIISVIGGFEDICLINVEATDGSVTQNAATEIIAGVVAEACGIGEVSAVDVSVSAEAIATAMARAIAEISASCIIEGDTTACIVSEANIIVTATAVATAFSFGFAEAVSTCDPPLCETSAEALLESISDVLVSATTSSVFSQCAGMGDRFDITILEEEIVAASITALSTIIAQATVIGGVCDFVLTVGASTTIGLPPA